MSIQTSKNYKINCSSFSDCIEKLTNHAITLISLIVTIVIILIIVGIGIATSMKLIEQTKYAEFLTKMRAQEEALQFKLTEYEIQVQGGKKLEYLLIDKVTEIEFNEFSQELQNIIIEARREEGITDKEDIFKLDISITGTENYASIYDGKIGSIYKINPVEIGDKKLFGTGTKGILVGGSDVLSELTDSVQIIDGIPVPIGFSYLEGTKETGFVIKNNIDGNEFVWIPTDLVAYQIYDWGKGVSATPFKEYYGSTNDEIIIQEINESVEKNKGYYISRYEMGTTVRRTSATQNLTTPVSRATSAGTPVYAYNWVTWDQAILMGNNLYNKTEHNVQSRLISARGWDTALKFIETADIAFPINGLNKGWYHNNYTNNPNYETGKPINTNKDNMKNNIYDMGGNMWEWTADQYISGSSNRSKRGGVCEDDGSSYSAAYREYNTNNVSLGNRGFRLVLYL